MNPEVPSSRASGPRASVGAIVSEPPPTWGRRFRTSRRAARPEGDGKDEMRPLAEPTTGAMPASSGRHGGAPGDARRRRPANRTQPVGPARAGAPPATVPPTPSAGPDAARRRRADRPVPGPRDASAGPGRDDGQAEPVRHPFDPRHVPPRCRRTPRSIANRSRPARTPITAAPASGGHGQGRASRPGGHGSRRSPVAPPDARYSVVPNGVEPGSRPRRIERGGSHRPRRDRGPPAAGAARARGAAAPERVDAFDGIAAARRLQDRTVVLSERLHGPRRSQPHPADPARDADGATRARDDRAARRDGRRDIRPPAQPVPLPGHRERPDEER